jgi:hypothetical protein
MTAPILQIRNKNGGAWSVHAEFPDGSFEEISGFKTENEANEWIAKDLQDWLDRRERIKVRKDRCRERQRGGALDREG